MWNKLNPELSLTSKTLFRKSFNLLIIVTRLACFCVLKLNALLYIVLLFVIVIVL